jgi:hypothetical protein
MTSGVQFPAPMELPFSQETNQEQEVRFLQSMLPIGEMPCDGADKYLQSS